jgi:hypothetical protein
VVKYIERCSEAHNYWQHVRPLVAAQVEEYLRRGFSSLTISFGCTGGQHRSVYFAERLAAHIRHEFPQANVRLTHREEGTWPKDVDSTASVDHADRARAQADRAAEGTNTSSARSARTRQDAAARRSV